MTFSQLITESIGWLTWLGLGLLFLTLISFIAGWGFKFRLIGATVFCFLLVASAFTFLESYQAPVVIEGAKHPPVVYDNGTNMVIAQAPDDFPIESIQPTLEEIARNLKGGGRNGSNVTVRLRKLVPLRDGVSKPEVLGEVIIDLDNNITILQDLSNYKIDEQEIPQQEQAKLDVNDQTLVEGMIDQGEDDSIVIEDELNLDLIELNPNKNQLNDSMNESTVNNYGNQDQ